MNSNWIRYAVLGLVGGGFSLFGCNDDRSAGAKTDTSYPFDAGVAESDGDKDTAATFDSDMRLDSDAWTLYDKYDCASIGPTAPFCNWMVCGNLASSGLCRAGPGCDDADCDEAAGFCHSRFCAPGLDLRDISEENTLRMGGCVEALMGCSGGGSKR